MCYFTHEYSVNWKCVVHLRHPQRVGSRHKHIYYACMCVCPSSPSGPPVVPGVEPGVSGPSEVLLPLAFFLHSNATWSLHSLWQFIPQSVNRPRECRQRVRAGRGGKEFFLNRFLYGHVGLHRECMFLFCCQ